MCGVGRLMEAFNLHWRYFVGLEDDLVKLSRFIEISEKNFDVYSIELVRLILSTCSEIDAVLKLLCALHCPEEQPGRITDYYKNISSDMRQKIKKESVNIIGSTIKIFPWKVWSKNKGPIWWKEHNDIKHQRSLNFEKSNLINFLNSLSGLFVSLIYYYKKLYIMKNPGFDPWVDKLKPQPQLMRLDRSHYSLLGYTD